MSKPNEKLEAIFEAAVALETEAQRADYLNRACPEPELRREVESLLAAHKNPDSLFARETVRVETPPSEVLGTMIGRYKLLEALGEGGCGAVWLAEQREPVRRKVALKIIKLGMDSKQVVARFEAERQALALMDHPNIAKVFDAGTTDTGRPYFVMELVRGISITRFCDENKLATGERLDLFIKVCQAVQHAHQKGIIHRDLKPSNILITLHDGVPVPKVIDFGIAKATQQELTDKTIHTLFQQFIGTPAYVSPEQAEMSGLEIDTRSDIYSLGVLLYELLTSMTPFDGKELLASGLEEMRRTIREKEPVRPSTRLNTLSAAEQTTTAHRRGTEPAKLEHLLRGDLDWIVMKCLEKDRARRYDTATGLAMDLTRHLTHEPVVARPPSAVYRLRKFAKRRRGFLVATAGIAVAILLGGTLAKIAGLAPSGSGGPGAPTQRLFQDGSTIVARRVWDAPDAGVAGSPSPDGRYLSYVDWSTGNLAVRDLVTGQSRPLTKKRTMLESIEFSESSVFSPSGSRLAYTWFGKGQGYHLRVIGADGSGDHAVFQSPDVFYLEPMAWSPNEKQILTALNGKDGKSQIALVSVEDGSVKSMHPGWPGQMGFSPDGRFIAFDRAADANVEQHDIFLMAAGGGSEITAVKDRADDRLVGWAADGTLLFTSDRTGTSDLWALSVKDGSPGGAPARIKQGLPAKHWPLGVTPTGTVFFRVRTGMTDVYVATFDPETGKFVAPSEPVTDQFIGANMAPEWSADGRFLAYVTQRGSGMTWRQKKSIVIRSLKDDSEREIRVAMDYVVAALRWSPDGRRFLVTGNDEKGQQGLYFIDAETGKVEPFAIPSQERGWVVLRYPCWSPDGESIFYVAQGGSFRLLRRNLSTGEENTVYWPSNGIGLMNPKLHFMTEPQLSPDGRWIAFGGHPTMNHPSLALFVIPASGGEPRELLRVQDPKEWLSLLSWTQDGRSLLVARGRTGDDKKNQELWRLPVDGGPARKLELGFPVPYGLRFHPDGRRVAFDSGEKRAEVWVMENVLPRLSVAK